MKSNNCPLCDAPVPILARACPYCGAPNPARRGIIVAAAAAAVLLIAAAGAAYVATRPAYVPSAPLSAGTSPRPSGNPAAPATTPPGANPSAAAPPAAATSPLAAATMGEYGWLAQTMIECDKVAMQQPKKLHFLIIPLTADPKDLPDWRLLAGSSIGNALTIPASDALGGLKRGTLTLYAEDYVFSVQDTATKLIYKWNAASGVKWFSTAEDAKIGAFRVQIQPVRKTQSSDWGELYSERGGSCLWVAAIIRE
jgi:hypothetical protein